MVFTLYKTGILRILEKKITVFSGKPTKLLKILKGTLRVLPLIRIQMQS